MDLKKITKNLLFIDIETVSVEPKYELLSERFQKLWLHKASFLKNENFFSKKIFKCSN